MYKFFLLQLLLTMQFENGADTLKQPIHSYCSINQKLIWFNSKFSSWFKKLVHLVFVISFIMMMMKLCNWRADFQFQNHVILCGKITMGEKLAIKLQIQLSNRFRLFFSFHRKSFLFHLLSKGQLKWMLVERISGLFVQSNRQSHCFHCMNRRNNNVFIWSKKVCTKRSNFKQKRRRRKKESEVPIGSIAQSKALKKKP